MTNLAHSLHTSSYDNCGILFFYLVSYYVLLFILSIYFSAVAHLPNIKYTREASLVASSLFARAVLLCCVLALTGLPPMPFFLPKLAVIGVIINSKPLTAVLAVFTLIFTGWFLYAKVAILLLSGVRSTSRPISFQTTTVGTVGAVALVLAGVFLVGGVFASSPILVWCHWIALPVIVCYRIF